MTAGMGGRRSRAEVGEGFFHQGRTGEKKRFSVGAGRQRGNTEIEDGWMIHTDDTGRVTLEGKHVRGGRWSA
jgi:hypothetical protein